MQCYSSCDRWFLLIISLLLHAAVSPGVAGGKAPGGLPDISLRHATGLSESTLSAKQMPSTDSLGTFIPSDAGGFEGLYILIQFPQQPRYAMTGAPIIVHMQGGWNAEGISGALKRWNLDGFIEISFNLPGGGHPGQKSGGVYDLRGENCARAARDVIRFALGQLADKNGQFLHQLAAPIKPLYSNVGLCGWSNGGNLTIATAGAFGAELPGLAWIVNWESPVGDGMPNVECGVNNDTNPAYNPNTGVFDLTMPAYCDTMTLRDTDLNLTYYGGLYFDINRNGALDFGQDFVVTPRFYQDKGFYSIRLTQAAFDKSLYPVPRPAHLSTVEQTQAFWLYRNGENWIAPAVQTNAGMMFLVEAGVQDHVQGALDHPHVLVQYEGFRTAGARFARLNPDRTYVEMVAGMHKPMAADNNAFRAFDHVSIRSALEPRGPNGVSSTMGVAASVCELADRTQYDNLSPQLEAVITGIVQHEQNFWDYTLQQNYPNPFNSDTRLQFTLVHKEQVSIKIYNLLGREVAQVIDEVLPAGQHARSFSATGLPSGIYFCRLTTGSFTKTIKMQLLR